MDNETKIRLLQENADHFRDMARTDRPGRDMWLRRAAACEAKVKAIREGD